MAQSLSHAPTRAKRQTTSGGAARREAILQAVLRIIASEGVRAVRHRAVATEANVPLAATTYYFSSLQDLLVESFAYWSATTKSEINRFREAMAELVIDREGEFVDESRRRQRSVDALSESTLSYLQQQVLEGRDDRTIELAFRHEALSDERLRNLVIANDRDMVASIMAFNKLLGTADPEADAEISMAVLLRLEQQALIDGFDDTHVRRVLRRHFTQLAGLVPTS